MELVEYIEYLDTEKDYIKQQTLHEIALLRGKLDMLEELIENDEVTAEDGLQENEWRIQKQITYLERYINAINSLKRID